jgi:hypothetical protein
MKKIYENENEILSLFNEGYNSVQIAAKLNKPKSYYKTVLRVFKKNNLQPRNNRLKLTEKDINNICNMYKSGMTQIDILQLFTQIKSEKTINDILKKNEVTLRRVGQQEIVKKHDYFEVIDSEAKAYFLGLIMADGCISKGWNNNYNVVQIGLKMKDKYLIEKFIKEINFCGKPYEESIEQKSSHSDFKSSDGFFSIRFTDNKMSSDLNKLGIVPNKTGKESLPCLSKELMPHFIRGLFDGDGSVFITNNKYLRISLYSSKKMCDDLISLFNLNNKVYKTKGVYFISTQNIDLIKQFYDYMYNDCNIYMIRKKEIFDNYYNNL